MALGSSNQISRVTSDCLMAKCGLTLLGDARNRRSGCGNAIMAKSDANWACGHAIRLKRVKDIILIADESLLKTFCLPVT